VIIDTSALIAILRAEDDASEMARAIEGAPTRRISAANYLETAVAPGERAIVPVVVNALRADVAIVGVQTELRVSRETPIAANHGRTGPP
jgi:ribonuclease VapC